jgi:hypothetical protein
MLLLQIQILNAAGKDKPVDKERCDGSVGISYVSVCPCIALQVSIEQQQIGYYNDRVLLEPGEKRLSSVDVFLASEASRKLRLVFREGGINRKHIARGLQRALRWKSFRALRYLVVSNQRAKTGCRDGSSLKAMASSDLSLLLLRCCHSYRICLNPATKVISFIASRRRVRRWHLLSSAVRSLAVWRTDAARPCRC